MSKRKATAELRPTRVLGALREVEPMERAGFIVDVDESNAKLWRVSLTTKLLKTHGMATLATQLVAWAQRVRKQPVLVIEIQFADDHPREPPFVRVVRPRFRALTGHVTVGGSICSKLVTTEGWRPDMSTESLLRTIMEAMNDGGAAIDTGASSSIDYALEEAVIAFKRAAATHGWSSRHAVQKAGPRA